MSWTGRPDCEPCCPGPLGATADGETVARYVNSNTVEPDKAAFQRAELTGENYDPISNDCGSSHGCSVDRIDGLNEEAIKSRSELQAVGRGNRVAEGARLAIVEDLRAIRHHDYPDDQVVYIYDDPKPDNDRHAVVRVSDKLHRGELKELQRDLVAAFSKRVA